MKKNDIEIEEEGKGVRGVLFNLIIDVSIEKRRSDEKMAMENDRRAFVSDADHWLLLMMMILSNF